jgi:hypothetical protein
MNILTKLAAPFAPDQVEWRVGSTNKRKWEQAGRQGPKRGLPLCYHDARMVMERLDEVVPGCWQVEPLPMHNGTFACRIGIKIDGEWLWRGDGAGPTGDVSDPEKREMAQKGGYSDAFKRAGVMWGIGRYLYSIKADWIVLDDYWGIPDSAKATLRRALEAGASNVTPKSSYRAHKDGDYPRIENLLRNAKTLRALETAWRNNQETIAVWPDHWREHITEEKDRCKALLGGGAKTEAA